MQQLPDRTTSNVVLTKVHLPVFDDLAFHRNERTKQTGSCPEEQDLRIVSFVLVPVPASRRLDKGVRTAPPSRYL